MSFSKDLGLEVPSTYHVFPLAIGSKVPDKGSSGFHDALPFLDAKLKWPQLLNGNIGLYPGPSGLLVIDVDVKGGALGSKTLSELQRKYGSLPETYTVTTPSGGWHLYFKRPCVERIGNVNIGAGIDIRCDGGYVLLAGSEINKSQYVVSKNQAVKDLPVAWLGLFKPVEVVEIIPVFPTVDRMRVQDALKSIPADLPYDEWVRVLAGLHSEGLREIADCWSSGDPRYSAKELERTWNSFNSNKPISVSIATVFHIEKKYLAQQWPEPIPLPSGLAPVAAYRADLLPAILRDFVEDIAGRMQCPTDFPAVSILISLATLVGKRCSIHPKKEDDWLVVPNLWGAVVGRPSLMKSPSIQEAMKPLDSLISEHSKEFNKKMELFEVATEVHAAKKDTWKKKLRKEIQKGNSVDSIASPEKPEKPIERRLRSSSGSIECLIKILQENPNGVLLFRDELTGWIRSLDKVGREGDRQFYLEAWNGNGASFDYDTFTHGHLHSEGLCLSVFGSIQPGPLSHMISYASKGGGGDDGLIQRFQLLVYPDNNKKWVNIDKKPNVEARDRICNLLNNLDVMLSSNAEGEPNVLHFSDDAQRLFDQWRYSLEIRIQNESNTQIESHLAKYRSLMPSIALLLHLADLSDRKVELSPVSLSSVTNAVEWCKYLESHARRIYGMQVVAEIEGAASLLNRLKRGDIKSPFTLRQVYRHHWSGL